MIKGVIAVGLLLSSFVLGMVFYNSSKFESEHQKRWEEILAEATPEPYTPSPSYTSFPAPSTTTEVLSAKEVTDPVVSCQVNANCGGGTVQLKQSICSQSVCCQLKSGWVFYESKEKCTIDQNAQFGSQNTANNIPAWTPSPVSTQPPCTVYYPATNSSYTYTTFTPAECEAEKAKYAKPIVTPAPTTDPNLIKAHQEACQQIVVEWQKYKEDFYATTYNSYSSSAEAVQALINERNAWQSEADSVGCTIYLSV